MVKRSTPSSGRRTRRPSKRRTLNVLFTCVGRRIELINAFRRAAGKLDIELAVHGADMTRLAPGMHHVDHAHVVPRLDDPSHVEALLDIAREQAIDLVIPLIDPELMPLSRAREHFERLGCRLVISSEAVVRTCQDKLLTYKALKAADIDTPTTWSCQAALRKKRHRFPYFLKPREGSAGQGNYKVDTLEELHVLSRRVPDPIVQEFVEGDEHTLDVYTGFDGVPRCVVPRKRLEVRSGEVSKGVVVKNRRIMAVGRRVARALGDCRGVVTVQCIVTPQREIRVIEINPRFGGGVPLGIHAGADFPLWMMAEHLGRPVTIDPAGFNDKVVMLRYDESVFCTMGQQNHRQR